MYPQEAIYKKLEGIKPGKVEVLYDDDDGFIDWQQVRVLHAHAKTNTDT